MFNKEETLYFINGNVRESFQKLIRDVLNILPILALSWGYIPKREALKVTPCSNGYGYSEERYSVYDFTSLIIPEIYELRSYKNCFQIVSENEIFRSQNLSFHIVLSSFVGDYLEGTNPKNIIFDQKKFDSIFEKYINALLSVTYESVSFCPLIGFESDTDSLMLDDDLIIRKIKSDERDKIWNSTSDSSRDLKVQLANTKYVIEHRLSKVKGSYACSSSELISIVFLAMRLLKSGEFWANRQYEVLLLPWMMKSLSTSGNAYSNHPLLDSYNYFLGKDEIIDLKRIVILVRNFHKIRNKPKYKYVSRAVEWFDRYFNETNIEHRFIFLMLLMEALCSENYETLYKLEHRISLIIGKHDEDRLSVISGFYHLYDGPRKIIHGTDVEIKENDLEKAEDYSRRLLYKYIISSLNGYGRQDILKLVDDALVSQNTREEMCKIFNFDIKDRGIADHFEHKKLTMHLFLKEELLSIKNEINNLEIHNSNVGPTYKLIQFNSLEDYFDINLWANIDEVYKSYFEYLKLLKMSSNLVKSLISETVRKIKTEKDAEVWTDRYIERVKKTNTISSSDAEGRTYGIDKFLRSDKIKELPEINDDTYLFFDEFSHNWDLKITLEDLNRNSKSIRNIIQEIHELVKDQDLIIEFRKGRIENSKLIAELIESLGK